MMERAAKELGLTSDQEAKWKVITEQEKPVLEAIHSDASLSKEAKRAKMLETNKSFGDQRRAVLTPEQQKKFDEMRAKMREHGPRGPKNDKQDN
jgi:Spy/CpxP family protein refolding chaperone